MILTGLHRQMLDTEFHFCGVNGTKSAGPLGAYGHSRAPLGMGNWVDGPAISRQLEGALAERRPRATNEEEKSRGHGIDDDSH